MGSISSAASRALMVRVQCRHINSGGTAMAAFCVDEFGLQPTLGGPFPLSRPDADKKLPCRQAQLGEQIVVTIQLGRLRLAHHKTRFDQGI